MCIHAIYGVLPPATPGNIKPQSTYLLLDCENACLMAQLSQPLDMYSPQSGTLSHMENSRPLDSVWPQLPTPSSRH